jgi:hypothetical protein
MTLTFGSDYFCFHPDLTGKPASAASAFFDSDLAAFKMHFEDDQMMAGYRVSTHYINSEPALSPDTVTTFPPPPSQAFFYQLSFLVCNVVDRDD